MRNLIIRIELMLMLVFGGVCLVGGTSVKAECTCCECENTDTICFTEENEDSSHVPNIFAPIIVGLLAGFVSAAIESVS